MTEKHRRVFCPHTKFWEKRKCLSRVLPLYEIPQLRLCCEVIFPILPRFEYSILPLPRGAMKFSLGCGKLKKISFDLLVFQRSYQMLLWCVTKGLSLILIINSIYFDSFVFFSLNVRVIPLPSKIHMKSRLISPISGSIK